MALLPVQPLTYLVFMPSPARSPGSAMASLPPNIFSCNFPANPRLVSLSLGGVKTVKEPVVVGRSEMQKIFLMDP